MNGFKWGILTLVTFQFLFSSCVEKEIKTSNKSVFITESARSIADNTFDPSTFFWMDSSAVKWEDALPVGNGRLGGMVFGTVEEERIQLNEETYWTGGPYSTVVSGGKDKLAEIQRLIFEGNPLDAHKLFGRYIMGYPVEQQKYQSLANLHLFFEPQSKPSSYARWLDLSTGVAGVEYEVDSVKYAREVFASFPDQTIVIRLSSNKKGRISFETELRGVRNSAHSNYGTDYFRMDGINDNELILTGKSADYLGIEGKIKFEARLIVQTNGGNVTRNGSRIHVENADEVTMYFVAATNFVNYKDVSGDEHERTLNILSPLRTADYHLVRQRSIENHQQYFNRVTLSLANTPNSFLPIDERMEAIQKVPDPSMAALSYQFGRYLLISSSRPGTQPANLQGIWNQDMNPSWDSKYTTNINTEMNYWGAEAANLSELTEPLVKMVEELTDQGSQVASEHYGANGWVFHQNTDIWRVAAPMDGPTWGTFTVGGAWLTTHIWEHYLFTQDTTFLKEKYPVIKGAVTFFMDFLVDHPNGKWLVTNPSNSPENPPKGEGYKYFYDEVTGMYYFTTITAGSTMDMQILHDLFSYYIDAEQILQMDREFASEVANALAKFPPPQIGKDGMLQEWTEDYEQLEEKHRHFSHLYGLYPGNVLSVNKTPNFVDPVKKVLEQREDGGTGFSRAWKMALWARLYDGNRANSIYKGYLKDQCYLSLFAKCFTPLQVDGSLGMTAAISEMLVQSHEGSIDLLPALPDEWKKGSFKGFKVRGGFELNMDWENGVVSSLEVLSTAGKEFIINTNRTIMVDDGNENFSIDINDGKASFSTKKGTRYKITFQ